MSFGVVLSTCRPTGSANDLLTYPFVAKLVKIDNNTDNKFA
jgi:hypothetical protein